MGSKRRFHTLQMLCFILAFWPHFSLSKLIYKSVGEEVQLDPEVSEKIDTIIWKKENNKIVDWDKDAGMQNYSRCSIEDQCELNFTSGVLIMKGLKSDDEGRYSAEINGKMRQEYSLKIGKHVKVYGSVGKVVQLDPEVTENINITWKRENNKIAEGIGNKVIYYGRCKIKNQCNLYPTSGVLRIKGLNQTDEGRYSAEINGKTLQHDFQLIVLVQHAGSHCLRDTRTCPCPPQCCPLRVSNVTWCCPAEGGPAHEHTSPSIAFLLL